MSTTLWGWPNYRAPAVYATPVQLNENPTKMRGNGDETHIAPSIRIYNSEEDELLHIISPKPTFRSLPLSSTDSQPTKALDLQLLPSFPSRSRSGSPITPKFSSDLFVSSNFTSFSTKSIDWLWFRISSSPLVSDRGFFLGFWSHIPGISCFFLLKSIDKDRSLWFFLVHFWFQGFPSDPFELSVADWFVYCGRFQFEESFHRW